MPQASEELALQIANLPSLYTRREKLCRDFFNSIRDNPEHKLHYLLPEKRESSNTRSQCPFPAPAKFKNDRYKHSFINYCILNYHDLQQL